MHWTLYACVRACLCIGPPPWSCKPRRPSRPIGKNPSTILAIGLTGLSDHGPGRAPALAWAPWPAGGTLRRDHGAMGTFILMSSFSWVVTHRIINDSLSDLGQEEFHPPPPNPWIDTGTWDVGLYAEDAPHSRRYVGYVRSIRNLSLSKIYDNVRRNQMATGRASYLRGTPAYIYNLHGLIACLPSSLPYWHVN